MIERVFQWKQVVTRLRGLRKDSSAIVAVIFAIIFPVLMGFLALALDVGRLQDLKRHQNNAAIAGALAAGHELWLVSSDADAIVAAKADAKRNNFDDASALTTITVNIPPLGGNYAGVANHAEVLIDTVVPTYFARVFGQDAVTVRSRAVTGLVKHGDACVIALEETRPFGMTIAGGGSLNAACGVQVNSNNGSALFLAGGTECLTSSTFIGVTGGIQGARNSPCISPEPVQAPPVNDPLAYLHDIAPYLTGCDFFNTRIQPGDDPVTLQPGTYCAGVVLGNYTDADSGITRVGFIPIPSIMISGGTVDFAPGVYTMSGGIQITGGTVTGDEVTFFNTSVNPSRRNLWGEFDIGGNGIVDLSAPTSGIYEGVLFWDDYRASNRRPTHTVTGSAQMSLGGALYFKETNVTWAGTSLATNWTMIISDTITVVGDAQVPADADWSFSEMAPPTRKVTLLE
jgi:Flp pilus assembly protein TadG